MADISPHDAGPGGFGNRAPASTQAAPPPKRRGCGCAPGIGGAVLLAIAVLVFTHPWATHIGGRWTPALAWHGAGTLQSAGGTRYGIFLDLAVSSGRGRGHRSFDGTAKLCTPDGEVYPLTVQGYLKNAFLSVEGKQATFYVSNPKDATPRISFTLTGAWHGEQLELSDKGGIAASFAAISRGKGLAAGGIAASQEASGVLRYATESEFAGVCPNHKSNSSF